VARAFLNESVETTKDMIDYFMECQLSHINLKHPGFMGSGNAFLEIQKQLEEERQAAIE
jgi:hypothetical protein